LLLRAQAVLDATADGEYAGFDEREPTSETGGKARAIEGLRKQHGYSSVVMIGDGVTDLEAKGPADVVIGFGGNVVRPPTSSLVRAVLPERG
jgi:phosphoserine phosphatase